MPRLWSRLMAVVALCALVALSFWAGHISSGAGLLQGQTVAPQVRVTVSEQSVGRILSLTATVSQPQRVLAANLLTGVVTAVRDTTLVKQGDVLYAVAGVPVRAVAGTVPFYRPLRVGDSGADVRQLNDALVSLSLLDASSATYGEATRDAVEAWQKRLGTSLTGTVALGELVTVPHLPARLALDNTVLILGTPLAGGERVVSGAAGDPVFELVLTEAQARNVPLGAAVTVQHQAKSWEGLVDSASTDATGQSHLRLASPTGGPVCGTDCGSLVLGGDVAMVARVAVVPPVTGPAVPVAAILTQPNGSASVTVVDPTGGLTTRQVSILGSSEGVAVVDGVKAGEVVVVTDQVTATSPTPTK